jgi:hypothetical protein
VIKLYIFLYIRWCHRQFEDFIKKSKTFKIKVGELTKYFSPSKKMKSLIFLKEDGERNIYDENGANEMDIVDEKLYP